MTQFISKKRVEDEHLTFTRLRDSNICPEDLPTDIDYGIIDADGVIYAGIIREDGAIDDAYTSWDNLDTYHRFNRRPKAVARKDDGWYRQTLFWNGDIDEFFLEHAARNQCQVSMSPVSADYVAAWLLELHEGHEVEFPQTGHLAISLPAKLRQEIGKVAAAENKPKSDWIVHRLEECVRDERSQASLKDHAKRNSEIVEWTKRNPISDIQPRDEKAV
jgi:hypothetical protein